MRIARRIVSSLPLVAAALLWSAVAFADVAPPPPPDAGDSASEDDGGCSVGAAEPMGALASLALGAGVFVYLRRR
jgi:hypothetical protein